MRSVSEVVDRTRMWKLISTLTGLVGGLLARKAMRAGYEAVRRDPDAPSPFDPSSAEFSWTDVLVWALAAGLGLGLAKVVSARVARFGWEAATGTLPPVPNGEAHVTTPRGAPA